MKNKLVDYFRRIAPLSDEEAQAILDSMVVRTCPKGTHLLMAGQVSTEAYFVLQGCVRQYALVDGEERSNGFFSEDEWVLSIHSMMNRTPADHFMVCAEDTTVVVGTEQREGDLYRRFPRFESISRRVMQKVLAEQQERFASYLTETPEQRYLKLSKARPDILQRIPQYQLASYIGVKPESLSRIRKRIATRGKPATPRRRA
ncbi:Crp/Fnr family transcriptional regulator [Corallococcus exiguus]|uniref:Crp/Fnr family transcriptional regulator n=1 Tax=Corallococcus TaxID=83461 RepID=UPI000EE06CBF|nr:MULTISPECIES: Crp/Fnr family transcriptional regulator [Corallococcus]NNB85257.1 Crp/Fnr family transcriptional regulator [Corallococcus exiguus]NNC02481.1 Crp/Fnr family transcriptional regulator [Corallococcus exiguus]NPC45921.1 Crp/Fnr family transcriptional regulator [Corallococcus exiguus]RKH83488.1 Crp/Fnr family transcriptional regulator [Corallococcus sp. AB032C]RKI17274.1 Crp/Fnr family transcriptional regulator [Corallococcus sp. AB030]